MRERKAGFLFTNFVELLENASLYYNVKFGEKSEDLQHVKMIPESSIVRK